MANAITRHELASVVAKEIATASNSYKGARWHTVNGQERALPFTVFAPSLQAKSFRDLQDSYGTFDMAVQGAGGRSYVGADGYTRSVPTLHCYHVKLEVDEGFYTGQAEIRERSFDSDL